MWDEERMNAPEAVFLNRFAAPRLVLILGMLPPDVVRFFYV
jgi:hypothetical protein